MESIHPELKLPARVVVAPVLVLNTLTRLLLGLGLRQFSMHPTQILRVKQEVLRADAGRLAAWAKRVMAAEDPSAEILIP